MDLNPGSALNKTNGVQLPEREIRIRNTAYPSLPDCPTYVILVAVDRPLRLLLVLHPAFETVYHSYFPFIWMQPRSGSGFNIMLNLKFENIRYNKIRNSNRFRKHLTINMCLTSKTVTKINFQYYRLQITVRYKCRVWISDPLKYFGYATVNCGSACFIERISIADPDPGSGAFLTPGSGIYDGKHPDLGSGIDIPDQ
jgi:hypothetical protein